MIFVGDGALLRQAIESALARAYRVDGVLGNTDQLRSFCSQRNIPFELAARVAANPNWVANRCTDGIGFSIDNSFLLSAQFLRAARIDFFGIHSGIIPLQRGNPIVASIFSILEGHQEYGVSLYKLDDGVDTGEVLAIRRFRLAPQVRLHELILQCAQLCQEVFEEHVERIMHGHYQVRSAEDDPARPVYRLRDLEKLRYYRDSDAFDRATDVGVLDNVLPDHHLEYLAELRRSSQLSCAVALAESQRSRALDFWRRQTEGVPPLGVPILLGEAPCEERMCSTYCFTIAGPTTEALRAFTSNAQISTKHALLACFLVLLSRYSGNRDLCTGTTPSSRETAKCPFLPVRISLEGSQSFREVALAVAERCVEVEARLHALTYDDCTCVPRDARGRMFDSAFVDASDVACNAATTFYIADWIWWYEECEGHTRVSILVGDAESGLVEQLATHYGQLLTQALLSPYQSVFLLDLLTQSEIQSFGKDWSQVRLPQSSYASVADLIEQQMSKTPAATAIVDVDGSFLTYAELDRAATYLAYRIRPCASSQITTVAIVFARRASVIIGMLASWKAGCVFVPLDPALPRGRIELILKDSGVSIIVCESATVSAVPAGQWRSIVFDRDDCIVDTQATSRHALKWGGEERDIAYVIYTSGSTGSPKGVMVEHRSLYMSFAGTQLAYPLRESDRLLGLACLGSDAVLWQLLAPLCWGSTVVLTESTADPRSILHAIRTFAVTFVDLVPSLLHALISELTGWPVDFSSLRAIVCGGENLPFTLLNQITTLIPHCEIINAYGPTEACCQVTFHRCSTQEQVSIGSPIPYTQLYILSPEGKPVPQGVVGEIYIGGNTLARGYLQQPALTEKRFVRDPFMADPKARMYCTGDMGRLLKNGEVEFLGRVDHQVKVRGHRVELGEIENALREFSDVSDAVVLQEQGGALSSRLIAYVVTKTVPNPQRLKSHLQSKLPSHMIPAALVPLAQWPLTQQQKIDRQALACLQDNAVRIGSECLPPRTKMEASLIEIWKRLLGVREIGIGDDFLELGGHSLMAVQLIAEVRDRYGVDLSLKSMAALRTVERMAQSITAGGSYPRQGTQRELLFADSELPSDIRLQSANPTSATRHIFMTGASGYLGRHFLRALLERTDADVHCLVRPDTSRGTEKLASALELAGFSGDRSRVHMIYGGLSAPRLGLSGDTWSTLSQRIGAIFHVGAAVNHMSSYQALRNTNVGSTLELLRLATTGSRKELHFVSSIDVLHSTAASSPETLLLGTPPEDFDGYAASKWVSDQLVAKAALRGVPASVYRVGYLGPHSEGTDANCSGWAELYFNALLKLGVVPDDCWSIPLTPVDLIAESICSLYTSGLANGRAFYLTHRERQVNCETILAAAAMLGVAMEVVPRAVWRVRLNAYCDAHPADAISVLGPYFDSTGEHGPVGLQVAAAPRDATSRLLQAVPDFDPADLIARFIASWFASAASGVHTRQRTA